MGSHRILRIPVTAVVLMVWMSGFCGVTGKVRGRVKDSTTGVPLFGANVMVSKEWVNGVEIDFPGTYLGAAADAGGEYIILRVPPGIYSIEVSMMGYSRLMQQQVKISADRTTVVDFSLVELVLEGQSVVVQAERDLVQLDVSGTENFVTSEEYERTPFANRMEDILSLQSGVRGNLVEEDISIRAGSTREVGFLMDGMDMMDKKMNRPMMSIQPGMIEEIKIMRNGFNAEYGQSQSGVINVVTKNPRDELRFSLDYQFTPAHMPHYGRNKYDPEWRWEWRLMDGPRAFEGDTLYVPDGRYESMYTWMGWNQYADKLEKDNNPDNDLTSEEAYELWKWRHRAIPYGDRNGHNVDVSLSGRVPFLPWRSNFVLGGKYEYHPFDYPQSTDHFDERVTSLKWVNSLGSNIKLILNGLYSEVRTVTTGEATGMWDRVERISYYGSSFPNYYPFYRPVLNRYSSVLGLKWVHTLSPRMFYEVMVNHFYVGWAQNLPDSARAEDGRYFHGRLYYDPRSGWIPREKGADDDVSGYRMYGGGMTWDHSWNRRIDLQSSLTWQFHPSHELKTGFDFNVNVIREDRVHWHNEDSTQSYLRQYRVTPVELGIYAQDKIEFHGMVANLGVRFDYFDPYTRRPDPDKALTFGTDREIYETYLAGNYPTFRPRPKTYISPRIGISHPLTANSKIYFNYGHFVQTPPTFHLYVLNVDGARPSLLQMGNADLPFEKTIAYELGCDIGLIGTLQLHLVAFYKNLDDVASTMTSAHSNQSLVMDWYDATDYAEIRGFEIEIRKPLGRYLTGWLNYNYVKKNESDLTIPGLSENPIVTDDPSVGINGVVWGVPPSVIIRIQPSAKGVITLSMPEGEGPKLLGVPLLEKTSLSCQLFYEGGAQIQHPRESFRDAHPNIWFQELPRYWANFRLSRKVSAGRVAMEFYLDASNLLHSEYRYPPSDRSGEDYYDDLYASGRIDKVGTGELSDPLILRTEDDDVWWGRVKTLVMGFRMDL